MVTWDTAIKDALWLYVNRNNITYCLGCSGEVIGQSNTPKNNFIWYYNNGWKDKILNGLTGANASMTAEQAYEIWAKINKNKMAFDCSGLVDFCIGYKGVHKYTSNNFAKMPTFESVSKGYAGAVLWKEGHVGLDIGYGYELEIGSYNDTIQLNKASLRSFTKSIKCTEINYTGADAR